VTWVTGFSAIPGTFVRGVELNRRHTMTPIARLFHHPVLPLLVLILVDMHLYASFLYSLA
jgi:hypothetical protein